MKLLALHQQCDATASSSKICESGRGAAGPRAAGEGPDEDRKSTRLNSSHDQISYAVFCLKKKKKTHSGDRLCATDNSVKFQVAEYPRTNIHAGLQPKARCEEDK